MRDATKSGRLVRQSPTPRKIGTKISIPSRPFEPDVYLGIDLGSRSWFVTAFSNREILLQEKIPSGVDNLDPILKQFKRARISSVFESGPFGYSLHDRLKERGVYSHVAAPDAIRPGSRDRLKTDRRDSEKLARGLATGSLRLIYVPEEPLRSWRSLVRFRFWLKRQAQRARARYGSLRVFHGLDSTSRSGDGDGLPECAVDATAESILREAIRGHREVWVDLEAQLKAVDKRLKAAVESEDEFALALRFKRIPGVGWLTALSLVVEIGDFHRFPNGEKFSSYLGLVPSEHSSGNKRSKGGITKTGNHLLRWLLYIAATKYRSKVPSARTFWEDLADRRSKKLATVAVARRMCHVILAMAKSKERYRMEM